MARVRSRIGSAIPQEEAEDLLIAPPDTRDFRGLILELAGPYRLNEEGWLVLLEAEKRDPTPWILEQADDVGLIDQELARASLTQWGLSEPFHLPWLLRNSQIRQWQGQQLVRWGKSVSDRLVLALADIEKPSTIQRMMEHIGEKSAHTTAINALRSDPRTIRTTRTTWALASWGTPEYRGIARSLQDILEQEGGTCTIDHLVERMDRTFRVAEHTTMTYCKAAMFIRRDGKIRLRDQDEEPFRCNPETIRNTPGVFDLGRRRLGRIMEVDRNTLRGSGTQLTEAAGAVLGPAGGR